MLKMSLTLINDDQVFLLPIHPDLKTLKLTMYWIQVNISLRKLGTSCRQLQRTRLRSKCSTNLGLSAWTSVKLFYTTKSTGRTSSSPSLFLTIVPLEVCQVLSSLKQLRCTWTSLIKRTMQGVKFEILLLDNQEQNNLLGKKTSHI